MAIANFNMLMVEREKKLMGEISYADISKLIFVRLCNH